MDAGKYESIRERALKRIAAKRSNQLNEMESAQEVVEFNKIENLMEWLNQPADRC
jgi:hypothetical protein